MNLPRKRRGVNQGVDRRRAVPVTAGEDELPRRTGGGLEGLECGDEPGMVLRRVLQPGHIKKERAGYAPGRADGRLGAGSVAGPEAIVIETVLDDGYAPGRHMEKGASECAEKLVGARA